MKYALIFLAVLAVTLVITIDESDGASDVLERTPAEDAGALRVRRAPTGKGKKGDKNKVNKEESDEDGDDDEERNNDDDGEDDKEDEKKGKPKKTPAKKPTAPPKKPGAVVSLLGLLGLGL